MLRGTASVFFVMQQSVSIKDTQTDIRLQKEGLYIIKMEDKVVKLRH